MTALALRPIGSNDYAVIEDGHPVGRIRLAAGKHGQRLAERESDELLVFAVRHRPPLIAITQQI